MERRVDGVSFQNLDQFACVLPQMRVRGRIGSHLFQQHRGQMGCSRATGLHVPGKMRQCAGQHARRRLSLMCVRFVHDASFHTAEKVPVEPGVRNILSTSPECSSSSLINSRA